MDLLLFILYFNENLKSVEYLSISYYDVIKYKDLNRRKPIECKTYRTQYFFLLLFHDEIDKEFNTTE